MVHWNMQSEFISIFTVWKLEVFFMKYEKAVKIYSFPMKDRESILLKTINTQTSHVHDG